MLRVEFIVIGIILIAVGIALAIQGYNSLNPDYVDMAVGFVKDLMAEKPTGKLNYNPVPGYLLLAAGIGLFSAGIVLIAKSRKTA